MNKKMIITESQLNRLSKIVSEQNGSDKYKMKVEVEPIYDGLNYKGYEINNIDCREMVISFDIELEYSSYGIKSANIYSLSGPSYIYANVSFYPDDENENKEDVVINLDWSNSSFIHIEDDAKIGWIGIDSPVQIILANDKSGNLFAKGININIRDI